MKVWKNKNGQLVMRSSGNGVKLYWTSVMIDKLRRLYPTTSNDDVAAELGVSVKTLRNKARELGLAKDPIYISEISKAKQRLSKLVPKKHTRRKGGGKISEYIANETEEQKRKRIEKIVKSRRATYRDSGLKGAETRRNWSEDKKREYIEKLKQVRKRAIENGAVEKYKETRRKMPLALKERISRNISMGKKNAKVS